MAAAEFHTFDKDIYTSLLCFAILLQLCVLSVDVLTAISRRIPVLRIRDSAAGTREGTTCSSQWFPEISK